MVRDQKDAKKLTTQRRSDRKDKESEIDGMLSDAAYIAKISSVAVSTREKEKERMEARAFVEEVVEAVSKKERRQKKHKNDQLNSDSNAEEGDTMFSASVSPTTMKANDAAFAASASQKEQKQQQQEQRAPPAASCPPQQFSAAASTNDGFHSCRSEEAEESLGDEGAGGDGERGQMGFLLSSPSEQRGFLSSPSICSTSAFLQQTLTERQKQQFEKDCAAFDWYREAMEHIEAMDFEDEYDAYKLKMLGTTEEGTTDNPYVLTAEQWWAKEKLARIQALNARLAKAKRKLKTGSEAHAGTGPSALRREKQKVETFTLNTSNRFGVLKDLKV